MLVFGGMENNCSALFVGERIQHNQFPFLPKMRLLLLTAETDQRPTKTANGCEKCALWCAICTPHQKTNWSSVYIVTTRIQGDSSWEFQLYKNTETLEKSDVVLSWQTDHAFLPNIRNTASASNLLSEWQLVIWQHLKQTHKIGQHLVEIHKLIALQDIPVVHDATTAHQEYGTNCLHSAAALLLE